MPGSLFADLPLNKKTNVDKIYEAALTKDEAKLKAAITFGCIDEWKVGSFQGAPIFYLAEQGHQLAVEFLIKHGASIDYAVLGAAAGRHHNFVETLLRRGASLTKAVCGFAQAGDSDAVETLLALGASIDAAAMGFAFNGDFERVKHCLSQGANISFVTKGAMFGGHEAYVSDLRSWGADLGSMAYYSAARGSFCHADFLVLNNKLDANHWSCGAALGGFSKERDRILKQGADVTMADCAATMGGHSSYAATQGVSIDEKAFGGAKGGHAMYVSKLMEEGADRDYALYGFITAGHQLAAEELFKKGASLNESIKYSVKDMTIKMVIQFCLLAWAHGNELAYVELEKLLATINSEKPAIQIAFEFLQPAIMQRVLLKAIQDKDESLAESILRLFQPQTTAGLGGSLLGATILNGNNEACYYLIERGYLSSQTREADGSTPLHLAAQNNNIPLLKDFCERHPLWMYQKNVDGETPLHVAAKYNALEAVEFLIAKEIPLHEKNRFEYTALDELLNVSIEEVKKPTLLRHASEPRMRTSSAVFHQPSSFFGTLIAKKKDFFEKLLTEIKRLKAQGETSTLKQRIEALERLQQRVEAQLNDKTPLILIILAWKEHAAGYDYQIIFRRANFAGAKRSGSQKLIESVFSEALMKALYQEAMLFRKEALVLLSVNASPKSPEKSSQEVDSRSVSRRASIDELERPQVNAPLFLPPSPITSSSFDNTQPVLATPPSRRLFRFLGSSSSTSKQSKGSANNTSNPNP